MTLTSWKPVADQALLKLNWNKLEGVAVPTTWPPIGRNKNDETVAAFWDVALEQTLLDHDWNDAIRQYRIDLIEPDQDTYQYFEGNAAGDLTLARADGMMKIRWIYPTQNWREENNLLLLENGGNFLVDQSNNDKYVIIRGVYRLDATEVTSPHFVEALALQLAVRMAPVLRPDQPQLEMKLYQQYQGKINEARSRTAIDQKDQERPTLFRQRSKLWVE